VNKEQKQIIITLILIAILIFAWAKNAKLVKKIVKGKAVQTNTSSYRAVSFAPEQVTYALEGQDKLRWGRCPFSGKHYSGISKFEGLNLMGILWDEENPSVLINDVIFREGESIQGVTVIEIQRHKVILSDGEESIELTLE